MVRAAAGAALAALSGCGNGGALPLIEGVDAAALKANVAELRRAVEHTDAPLPADVGDALESADGDAAVRALQSGLDPLCLFLLRLEGGDPEIVRGPAAPELAENGWRQFLVKVDNESRAAVPIRFLSPEIEPLAGSPEEEVPQRWLHLRTLRQPRGFQLSGQRVEYHVLQLYSRDAGERTARFAFATPGMGAELARSNEIAVAFDCARSAPVTLRIADADGGPATAAVVIQDAQGRAYPPLAKRLAPDFAFHSQVYRADGARIPLPEGSYTFTVTRGPEYLPERREVLVTGAGQPVEFALRRWIDPRRYGLWSGDTHLHASGCAHYSRPTPGVMPSDMLQHCAGEDLHVGCVLTWHPEFDFQKQFFTGGVHPVSTHAHLIRYDVEVSGFGSHQSGHLVLLGLKEQIYPGGDSDRHWPTLCLNTLKWAKAQGAVTGFGHAGAGLAVDSTELPNYLIPRFDGIGANEFIVDVTHQVPGPDGAPVAAVDYIGVGDTPPYWELNSWYHVLNCGLRPRIAGETDFPCLYTDRVGVARQYVRIEGPLAFDAWIDGIRTGRGYVSDGLSHPLDFDVGGQRPGEGGSELHLATAGTVTVSARVAARLEREPATRFIERRRSSEARKTERRIAGLGTWPFQPEKPYWHLELARLGTTRNVPVEVIVNGFAVARREIAADGAEHDVTFEVPIERSSWVALRVYPSSHTNPVFVLVGGRPIRASRKSAEWCLAGVDRCWEQKKGLVRPHERNDAERAYEHARAFYRDVMVESEN